MKCVSIKKILNWLGKIFNQKPKDETNLILLPEDEAKFLRLLQTIEINSINTRDYFYKKYGGVVKYNGLTEVKLPETTIFSDSPLNFKFLLEEQNKDLPPDYFVANIDEFKDARKNFAVLEKQMILKLGEGERCDATNCLLRRWIFGVFNVELYAWPYDLQSEWVKQQRSFDPSRFNEIAVSITQKQINLYPRKDLEWIAKAIINKNKSKESNSILKLNIENLSVSNFTPPTYTYRNTSIFQSIIQKNEIIIWKNKSFEEFGITSKESSLVFSTKEFNKLVLVQLQAAKGPEGSEIVMQTKKQIKKEPFVQTTLLISGKINGLDSIAMQLKDFWNLEIEMQHALND